MSHNKGDYPEKGYRLLVCGTTEKRGTDMAASLVIAIVVGGFVSAWLLSNSVCKWYTRRHDRRGADTLDRMSGNAD